MAADSKNIIQERLERFFKPGNPSPDQDTRAMRRERVAVFIVAYLMAISLWFIVNLNGDYRITVNIPVEAGAVSPNMALVDGLPELLEVEVSGDGWKLRNIYNNPRESTCLLYTSDAADE